MKKKRKNEENHSEGKDNNEDALNMTDDNQQDSPLTPSIRKPSNEDQQVSSLLSSTSQTVEQGMKLSKNIKKQARKLFTGGYSRGMEKVIKDELFNVSSMHYHQELEELEGKQSKDVNKDVLNFSRYFGGKKRNSSKRAYLNKVENDIMKEEANSRKEKMDKALSNSVMMSAAAPDKIREQVESHFECEEHLPQHDDIDIYKDIVNSLLSMESTHTGEMEWNDVVDLASIDLPNHFIDG